MRTVLAVGSPKDEIAAWAAALKNDGAAFAVIFDHHHNRVFHHALRMTANVHDAEDVTAAAFLELWRRRKSVRVVDDSVLPWLLVTTTNLSRNLTRGLRRHRTFIASLPRAVEGRSAEDLAVEHIEVLQRAAQIREALSTLTPADSALIALTTFENFSSAQVAVALGISEGAARTRLHRARARVATALDSLAPAGNDTQTKENGR